MKDKNRSVELTDEQLDKVCGGGSPIPLIEGEPTSTILWHTVHNVPVGTVYSIEATRHCPVCNRTMNVRLGVSPEQYSCPDDAKFVLQRIPGGSGDNYCKVILCE